MRKLLVPLAITLAVIGGVRFAAAQQPVDGKTTEELKKVDSVPPATAPKLSEQAGTTEPSAKVGNTNPDPNAVFVNGMLTVPGALTDVDTAPAKYSARTDADDQVPIAGYRFKKLGAEQLQQIS